MCDYISAVLYLGACKQRVWVNKTTWVETLQMSHTHTHACLWGLSVDYRELTRRLAAESKDNKKEHQLNHFNALYLNKKGLKITFFINFFIYPWML